VVVECRMWLSQSSMSSDVVVECRMWLSQSSMSSDVVVDSRMAWNPSSMNAAGPSGSLPQSPGCRATSKTRLSRRTSS